MPRSAAHHESRRSISFCCGDEWTTFHGVVLTGQPFSGS